MFQYALGRCLAEKNRNTLLLDLTFLHARVPLKKFVFRNYNLDVFNINPGFTFLSSINTKSPLILALSLLIAKSKSIFGIQKYVSEKTFTFEKNILNLKGSIYLDGYWQSPKYFADIEDIIRKEFTLKNFLGEKATEWKNKISQSSVPTSLHIRRGDYIYNKKTNLHHGNCSLNYYQEAVKSLEQRFSKDLVFFIFSDDIEWAKENLRLNFPTYFVSDREIKDYEELMLMSYCKNNIIANSSFSWWGAWLNNKKDKIVIYPQKWFNDGNNTKDLIPESWIKL
jgi:hypothetical protein